jgi:hypothetical protein
MDEAQLLAKEGAMKLLSGERLRYSTNVLKATRKSRLVDRVLLVTDRSVCDVQVKGAQLKMLHQVQLRDIKGYSVCPDPGSSAFVIHVDRQNNATKDLLLSSPKRDSICEQLALAFWERVRRQLVRRDWCVWYFFPTPIHAATLTENYPRHSDCAKTQRDEMSRQGPEWLQRQNPCRAACARRRGSNSQRSGCLGH